MNTEEYIRTVLLSIKDERRKQGRTQAEVAEQLGISTTQYKNLENYRSKITLEQLVNICNVLGMQPPQLLSGGYGGRNLPSVNKNDLQELEDNLFNRLKGLITGKK